MRRLWPSLLAGGAVLLLTACGNDAPVDPYAEQRAASSYQESVNDMARWEVFKTALLLLALLLAVAVVVSAAIWLGAHARRAVLVSDLVYPDAAGRLPFERALLADPSVAASALAAFHQTQYRVARSAAATPTHYHNEIHTLPGPEPLQLEAPADVPQLTAPHIPTFSELLTNGTIAAGSRLLLGYTAELQPQWGTWLQVYSSLIAGLPGSGKSTTIRYLACGVALNQGRFIVIDPHMGAGDDSLADSLAGLQAAYLCAPAGDPGTVRQAIALADQHMDARIAGHEPARTPLVICVDELAAMMSNPSWQEVADLLARFLEKVAREGRKRGVFVLAGTQNVKGTRTGGTELKDAFASIFAHRNRRNQNQMLDLDPDESRLVKRLPTGAAYFVPTTGEGQVLYIPYTDADDVTRVGTLLQSGYNPAMDRLPDERARVTSMDAARSPAKPEVAAVAAEAERAYQLFLGNQDMAKIVFELTGVRSNQGSRYQAELARVQELVRVAARARSEEAA